jgi:hypothetical protein
LAIGNRQYFKSSHRSQSRLQILPAAAAELQLNAIFEHDNVIAIEMGVQLFDPLEVDDD